MKNKNITHTCTQHIPSTRLCMCADSYSMGSVEKSEDNVEEQAFSSHQRAALPTPVFLSKLSYCFQSVESKLH